MSAPRVHVLRRLAAHGLHPDTRLGQHFLVDENLVDLSVRTAGVGPDDVVLEVGAGIGVLTAALARAARQVHTIELDRRIEPVLGEILEPFDNVTVHWGDAMDLAWSLPAEPPTLMVANLPYNIATPLVLESTWRLPTLRAWGVMVQREVADRWAATPGDPRYGAPSVLLQLAADQEFRRNVGREVFAPPPRVDSAFVVWRRHAEGASEAVRRAVRTAFAQRRKMLRNTLPGGGADREHLVGAMADLGLPATARAEDLTSAQHARLAEAVRWTN